MPSKIIFRGLLATAVVAAASAALLSTRATAAFPFVGTCLNPTGCSICCPVCDHVCKLDAEQVEEDIPCFDVESKVICIPRVVFPWQKKKCSSCDSCDGAGCNSCVHNGARVRRICVLKTDKIKCPKCKYTWSAEKKCVGCDSGCDGCCDSGCDATLPTEWQAAASVPSADPPSTDPQSTEPPSPASQTTITAPMQPVRISQPGW